MDFSGKQSNTAQLDLIQVDRVFGDATANKCSQRWTTNNQVAQLMCHNFASPIADATRLCDPCAGNGSLLDILSGYTSARLFGYELDESIDHHDSVEYGVDSRTLGRDVTVDCIVTNLPWYGVFDSFVGHWRTAFPRAHIYALCCDQERTRNGPKEWLKDNPPHVVAWLPGRQTFGNGVGGTAYPFSTSWYYWAPYKNTNSYIIQL